MKKTKIILTITAVALLLLAAQSCNDNKSKNANNAEQTEEKGKAYTSAYVCPMHCEGSGSDKEGQCPVCEMDYVENKDIKKTKSAF